MAIVGFHYTKINAEKKKGFVGKINVNNNVMVNGVKEARVNLGKDNQKGIEFKFIYKVSYDPDVASISLEGAGVLLHPGEKITQVLEMWEKEKKLPQDVTKEIYNFLLEKCTIESLLLGKEMQFKPHVLLPKVPEQAETKKVKKESKKE